MFGRGVSLARIGRGDVATERRKRPIVWLGCLLLVLGFIVRLMVPYRRIWGNLASRSDGGSALSIAAVGRRDSDFDAEFTSLVTDIRQAVTGPARS